MSTQHLSDEAVAAFADGVLAGHARDRASRHTGECDECARAVRVQREAVLALRAAPAPALPVGLLDRLRSVPATTVIGSVPAAVAADGSAMFAAFGTLSTAALVPTAGVAHRSRRLAPFALTAAAVAAAGVLAVASSGGATAAQQEPSSPGQARVVPVDLTDAGDGAQPSSRAAWSATTDRDTAFPVSDESEDGYARPVGVAGTFAARAEAPPYTPPPPTVAPQEQAVFGRPPGAPEFAPLPGERIAPTTTPPAPVDPALRARFGATGQAAEGFDPAPGTRISPSEANRESPWWKPDAPTDPWRDPNSRFWLGRAAIFRSGRATQVDPDEDTEAGEADPIPPEDDGDTAVATITPRRLRFGLSALAIMLAAGLVAGVLGGGVGYWLANHSNHLLHRSVSLSKLDTPANRPPTSVAGIAKRAGPAVVSIAVTTPDEYAVGSGVVINDNGYVLTNNHVVAAAAGSGGGTIIVTFSDEATAKAQIVGRDPISDLAVLKVPTDKLTVATLGNSDLLAVGDPVIAIGSPLGLQGTVTAGIVSALNRAVSVTSDDGDSTTYYSAIRTDAAINPGNSGGALVDAAGAVVGINSAAALSTSNGSGQQESISGIGYAIPINYARTIAEELIKSGKATHGSLGAAGKTATTSDFTQQGAYLEQVVPKGPADAAGLKNGDVIVAADGQAVSSYDQLAVIVEQHQPGDTISVTYFDGAAKKTTKVKLGSA